MSETNLENVPKVAELEQEIAPEGPGEDTLPATDTNSVLEAQRQEAGEDAPWTEAESEPDTMSAEEVGNAIRGNARDLVLDRNDGKFDTDGYAEVDSLDGITVGGDIVYQPKLEDQGAIVPGVFAAGRLTQDLSESAAAIGVQAALRERNLETLRENRLQARIWASPAHLSFGETNRHLKIRTADSGFTATVCQSII